jgi:hypothetical protein
MIKSRRMRWAGHVALMVERRDKNSILMEKPEGSRPITITRRRWENNIKWIFKK